MSTEDLPQIYLVTPSVIDLDFYPDQLARVLDSLEIACLRLGLASIDEDHISRAADALRDIAHARDIMLVVERHALLVERLGLDGVHLMDGGRNLR
ncbi:MAG: thiamine phosphate synthase, partial [Planktomarina sp.]|nr:thiamine phosphate synthase [Planktomarina sp.]